MSKKKKIIVLIIAAILLISTGITIGVSGVLDPYEKHIKLGYKLLYEGKYEEAILAFDKAIEIDVKRDKAYIGKADVYVTRCDDNTLEDLKTVLKTAYDYHYNDKNIVDAIIRLADDLAEKERIEWAVDLLNFGYELTNDERINEHKIEIFNNFADGFLIKLYEMFESGDKEGVRTEIQSDKYLNFVKLVNDIDYKYIYFPETNKSQTGKGIALYYVDTENYGKVFVYYGGFENGLRSGTGTWAGANGIQYYWFEGQWNNDAPNGNGEILEVKDESKIKKEPNHTYALRIETVGSFKNGLYDGAINETWYMDDGDQMIWKTITSVNGIYQQMSPLPADIVNSSYAQENRAKGEYLVSVTEDGADLWNNGSIQSIIGFNK